MNAMSLLLAIAAAVARGNEWKCERDGERGGGKMPGLGRSIDPEQPGRP